jgi:hypothetical protein
MDLGWCQAPDRGLPAPDTTLYLTLDRGAAAARAGYGEERYEKQEFQTKVRPGPQCPVTGGWGRRGGGTGVVPMLCGCTSMKMPRCTSSYMFAHEIKVPAHPA